MKGARLTIALSLFLTAPTAYGGVKWATVAAVAANTTTVGVNLMDIKATFHKTVKTVKTIKTTTVKVAKKIVGKK